MNYIISTNHYFQEKVQLIEENQYKNKLSIYIHTVQNINRKHLSSFIRNTLFFSKSYF